MGNNLKKIREDAGLTHAEAAERMNMSRSGFIKLERGERKLSEDHIRLASKVFNVPASSIISTIKMIPVLGYVGAGSIIHLSDPDQGMFEEVETPDDATEKTVAVRIEGDCLGSFLNGWLVFYDDEPKAPTLDMIGQLCIVWLDGGEILIKELRKGGVPGLFSLYSNDKPIYDVLVHKAVIVKSMRRG